MILVTGGTGLVGAHLLYHLTLKEDKIRAIYRSKEKLKTVQKVFSLYTEHAEEVFSTIEWVAANITEVPSMIPVFVGIKKVYHCAALISFNPKDYVEMRKVNIHGTAIMVNLAIDAQVEKICLVSSIATLSEATNNKMITEENHWNDQADNHGYGITKYGAEMEVWRASQEGVDVVIVNPGVILGSGFFNKGSGSIFKQLYNGFKYYTMGVTGFIGVKDVVKSMILLMNSSITNEQFILVSENKSFRDVFSLIATNFSKNPPRIKIRPWHTAILWRFAWLVSKITKKDALLTKHAAASAHAVSCYSSEKMATTTGYRFQKIEEVVKETCSEYLKISS